ncbi:MAG: hypothetical protein PHO36_11105 [Parabacteroides sp.]|nr:hypothetical protein [Parabacteroides sp.]
MKTMQNFISDLHIIRDKHFKEMISEYKNKYANTSYWNGPELKIENIVDCFILLTKDKKSLSVYFDNFSEIIDLSYILYFSRYNHVANYTNGGLDFLGFFNDKFESVNKININNFDIVDIEGDCSFTGIRKPTFSFKLIHKSGNNHASLRGDLLVSKTCQRALDSVWELEEFYSRFAKRIIESPPSADGYKSY